MTFEKVMCRDCNNRRSAHYDRAVIDWADYVKSSEPEILRRGQYSQAQIWTDWRTGRRYLAGFFTKHVACHLAQAYIEVPAAMVGFLDGETDFPPAHLSFQLEIREDIAEALVEPVAQGLLGNDRNGALWIGEVGVEISRSSNTVEIVFGHFTFRWLRVNWRYTREQTRGATNFARKTVRLVRDRNIPREEVERTLMAWREAEQT